MYRSLHIRFGCAVAVALMLCGDHAVQAQYGIVISGAGPTNRSMGGASTAAPLDASGALYWNPAAITGLCRSELDVGLEVLYPNAHVSSSISANSFGPGFPPVTLAGSDRSDAGVFLLPTVGLVYQPQDSPIVWGLGLFSAGGFSTNFPASNTNPILTPQAPNGLGLGPVHADLQIFQLAPTAALRITDRLSVGIAPTLSLARLVADPAFLAAPDDANGDGFGSYPPATHGRIRAGGGVQAGVFYSTCAAWHFGASIKSPQWFEAFSYKSVNELGQPRTAQFRFDYPMIASLGTSYTGINRWVFAADFRFIDYHNATGFDSTGFDANGAVKGLGWNSIYAVALGTQYELTPCTSLRLGYSYNTNPIDDANTIFSVPAPIVLEHTVYVGASQKITDNFLLSVAYAHAFENSVQGPYVAPFGPIPGTSVKSTLSADTVVFGATIKF